MRPEWCRDKDCEPLANTKECCIGEPSVPKEHDGILNDMVLCSDDGISWYVNARDLRVLFNLIARALRSKGEALPDWIYRHLTRELPDNPEQKVEWL